MDSRGIERLQEAGIRWHTKLERRNRRNLTKSERVRQRSESFTDLARRNRVISRRAQQIVNLENSLESTYEGQDNKWIVLKAGDSENHSWVIGNITKSDPVIGQKQKNFGNYYSITTHTASAATAHRIQQGHFFYMSMLDTSPGQREDTMRITSLSGDTAIGDDEVFMEHAIPHSSGRRISPVTAMSRYFKHRRVGTRLEYFECTLDIFEQAIADPELNPHFTSSIQRQEQQLPQTG